MRCETGETGEPVTPGNEPRAVQPQGDREPEYLVVAPGEYLVVGHEADGTPIRLRVK